MLFKYHFSSTQRKYFSRLFTRLNTFLPVGQLVISLAAAALLAAGGIGAEGTLAHKRGAAGVEGGRHAALLLPALLPLQTGGESTAHRVAQSLPLAECRGSTRHALSTTARGPTNFKRKSRFQKFTEDKQSLRASVEKSSCCLSCCAL